MSKEYIKNYILDNHVLKTYEYKKSNEVKKEALFDFLKLIRKNQWMTTILFYLFGFIIYIGYFFFKRAGSVPLVYGGEFIYVIVAVSAIFILIPIVFVLISISMAFLYNYDKQQDSFKNDILFSKSSFINTLSALISVFIVLIFALLLDNYAHKTKIYDYLINHEIIFPIIFLIIFFIFLYILYRIAIWGILKIILIEKLKMIFSLTIIALISIPLLLQIFIFEKIDAIANSFSIFFIATGSFLLYLFLTSDEKSKKELSYCIFISLISLIIGCVVGFSNPVFKWLDFGNINYSYISLDKDVKNTIPIKLINKNDLNQYFYIENLSNKNDHNKTDIEIIYDYNKNNTFEYKNTNGTKIIEYIPKNCFKFINTNNQAMDIKNKIIKYTFINENNESKTEEKALATPEKYLTYIEEKEDVLIIYNIKALSTLGRFWHLETRGGTRFKVESKFINGSS